MLVIVWWFDSWFQTSNNSMIWISVLYQVKYAYSFASEICIFICKWNMHIHLQVKYAYSFASAICTLICIRKIHIHIQVKYAYSYASEICIFIYKWNMNISVVAIWMFNCCVVVLLHVTISFVVLSIIAALRGTVKALCKCIITLRLSASVDPRCFVFVSAWWCHISTGNRQSK